MRIGESLFDFDGSTGGRFYDKEETAKEKAFNEAARKKSNDKQNAKQNLSALTPLIQKMQNASVNISISTEILNKRAYLLIKESTDNYAILHICDKNFLMQLNHKDEVRIIKQDMSQSSKHTPYKTFFENTDNYTTVHTSDTESLNKWAWSVFNTSINRNCFSNLKPFLSYYN